jgi:hypothetical protein
VTAAMHHTGESDLAAQRWRDALARLDYAERHKASEEEIEGLADAVIEAKIAMFQAGLVGGRTLPDFVQVALERDRALLRIPVDPTMPPQDLARGA